MEKAKRKEGNQTDQKPKYLVGDCGSSLYDSFELKSLERQLRSYILARTLSVPHPMDRRAQPSPPGRPLPTRSAAKRSSKRRSNRIRPSKFSKSFRKLARIMSLQKLVGSIFRPKQSDDSSVKTQGGLKGGSYNNVYYGPAAFYTKPKAVESGGDDVYGGSRNLKFGPGWLCAPDAAKGGQDRRGGPPDSKSLVGRSDRLTKSFTATSGITRISIREETVEETIIRSKHYTIYINNFFVFEEGHFNTESNHELAYSQDFVRWCSMIKV
ncbi:hypothetical protein RHGRI_005988 [Rhododendron griersonianum]|uniref:Uncharacterized protein n=1 Tax=Rhododendron griersonianum TaxID=479676 RepID=A0AAV6LFB5_9ERIC|nr:hypothetical protein RHGRI_005988 [Rhododendron griersonianum]